MYVAYTGNDLVGAWLLRPWGQKEDARSDALGDFVLEPRKVDVGLVSTPPCPCRDLVQYAPRAFSSATELTAKHLPVERLARLRQPRDAADGVIGDRMEPAVYAVPRAHASRSNMPLGAWRTCEVPVAAMNACLVAGYDAVIFHAASERISITIRDQDSCSHTCPSRYWARLYVDPSRGACASAASITACSSPASWSIGDADARKP